MHRRPLEVVADRHLVGHAHAAVQLDGVLADEVAGAVPICTLAAETALARSSVAARRA